MPKPEERPPMLSGQTTRFALGCGNLFVTVNTKDSKPFEVFAILGKNGGCSTAMLEMACRLISVALRSGIDASVLVKHLTGIQCLNQAWDNGEHLLSCADCIARALKDRP